MLGHLVSKYRTKRRFTLRKLAEMTGLSYSFISDIEHGRTNPSVRTLLLLMDVLDIPASELEAVHVGHSERVAARESA